MFTVPVHVSPRILFGATEFFGALPVTRLGAGRDANTTYYGADKKTSIDHLVPCSSISFGESLCFSPYKVSETRGLPLCRSKLIMFFFRKVLP